MLETRSGCGDEDRDISVRPSPPPADLFILPARRHRLVVGLASALAVGFLIYQACWNPEIEFLTPSVTGQWILDPPEQVFPETVSGTVLYRRRFELTAVPAQWTLTARAASKFTMAVNGHAVAQNNVPAEHNWKLGQSFDIAPLLAPGQNVIEIRVTHDKGRPALLVEARHPAGIGLNLSSSTEWESAAGPHYSSWHPCVLPNQEPPVFGDDRSPIQRSPYFPFFAAAFGAYALWILVAMNPGQVFYRKAAAPAAIHTGPAPTGRQTPSRLSGSPAAYLLPLLVLCILAVNVHNFAAYPFSRSYFDTEAHVEYIRYVAAHWRAPLANQGWEMYQPPLYYFVSAILYRCAGGAPGEPGSLKAVQIIGMLSGLAIILFAWLSVRHVYRSNRPLQLMGLSVAGFLPMTLYMNPTISNEVFSAAMIACAIYLLIRDGFRDVIGSRRAFVLGTVVGLAMLSKYTALLVFLVAMAVLGLRILVRPLQRRREAAVLGIFVVTVISISGWYYARNTLVFHKPFVANWDEESGFHVEQLPGYRTAGFYLRFGSVFARTPERSRWTSFWDGYYGSMWADPHFNMIDHRDGRAASRSNVILCLALLPSAAMALGFARSLKRFLADRVYDAAFALVAISIATILACIWYTLQLPAITTVKAFYSLSLLPAIAVFSGAGLYEMAGNLRKFAPLLYLGLAALLIMIGFLYWYPAGN